jgi:hypothetical protein
MDFRAIYTKTLQKIYKRYVNLSGVLFIETTPEWFEVKRNLENGRKRIKLLAS